MKRERTNDLFNVVRELAGQQGRKVVRIIQGRNERPIRGLAPAEHRLGPPTDVPRQRAVGPLGSVQRIKKMKNPDRDLRRDPSPSK